MNTKTVLINAAIFLGAALAGWFWVWGNVADVSYLRGQINLRRGTMDLEKEIIQKLNSINQVLDSQKSNVERLGQAIPTTEERPEIISMMEQLASQNGLNLKNIDITALTEETRPVQTSKNEKSNLSSQTLRRLNINLSLAGNYSSLKSWLEAVEKNLRIVDVKDVSISVKESVSPSVEVLPALNPPLDLTIKTTAYALAR